MIQRIEKRKKYASCNDRTQNCRMFFTLQKNENKFVQLHFLAEYSILSTIREINKMFSMCWFEILFSFLFWYSRASKLFKWNLIAMRDA